MFGGIDPVRYALIAAMALALGFSLGVLRAVARTSARWRILGVVLSWATLLLGNLARLRTPPPGDGVVPVELIAAAVYIYGVWYDCTARRRDLAARSFIRRPSRSKKPV